MATVGNTTSGAQFANGAVDRLRLLRVQAPADIQPPTSFSAFLDRSTTGTQAEFLVRGVIYSDNGGVPGTLLLTSEELAPGGVALNSAALYTGNFPAWINANPTPGDFYWIGVHMSRPIVTFHNTGAANIARQGDDGYANGPPPLWSSVTNDTGQNRDYSFYITYTAQNSRGRVSHFELETPDPFAATDSAFGISQIPTGSANGSTARLRVTRFTAPDDINDAVDIFAYMDRTTTGASGFGVKGVIYDSDGTAGAPGTLLNSVVLTTNATLNSPQWYSATFGSPEALTAGQDYWIGVHMERPVVNYYVPQQPDGTSIHADSAYATGPPADFATAVTPTNEPRAYAVYVTYASLKRGQVSQVEFEVPSEPRRGRLSFVELETPSDDRMGQVSWLEFTVPTSGVGSEVDYGFILRDQSDSALRDGGARLRESDPLVQLNRRAQISQLELETTDVQTRARVSFVEMQTPDDTARRAWLSQVEMETPELGALLREARVSQVEMEVPNEPGSPEPGTTRRRRSFPDEDILHGRTSRGPRP